MKRFIATYFLAIPALLCATPGIAATVTMTPGLLLPQLQVGDTFTVTISANVPNTFAATMQLSFDASRMELVDTDPGPGVVQGIPLAPWTVFTKNSPRTASPALFDVERPTPTSANPAVYNVAQLTFRAIAAGASNILINDDGGSASGWFDATTAEYIPNTYIQLSTIVVPAITVSDSVAPTNDLLLPFGLVTAGATSVARTVTVRNNGSQNLQLGGVAQANPLIPSYSLTSDTCSGATLPPTAMCTLTIVFSPVAEGDAPDTFDIPSNDPVRPTVAVSVSGTGTGPPDAIPNGFAFIDQAGAGLSTQVTSNAVTISGINVPAALSVSGDESSAYSIDGGAFTSVAGIVTNGSSVRVRHTSSAAPDTSVDTILTVGGVSDTFTSTTIKYAIDDGVTTFRNQPVDIDVLQNDVGLLPTVYVGVWTNPLHGTATVSGAPGSPAGIRVTYTPNPGYVGPDSFEYWLETGPLVDYAVVNVTVINPDLDDDGVLNNVDNCILLPNPGQCDSDGDGYGNRCDGDMTGNGLTNAQDTVVMRQLIQDPSVPPTYNKGDINCNGFVNAQDLTLFRKLLGAPPGPSGLHP